MKRKLLILFSCAFIFGCTSSSVPVYNSAEFKTENYQKNVDNAVDAADLLSDFDQTKIPVAQVEPVDISNLVQADLYYNQGDYVRAFPFYNQMSLKYKDPRIIYKAIVCLEHVSITPEQAKSLNELVSLFIQTDPNSKLAKLFQIKVALNSHDVNLAEKDLDDLMSNNKDNARVILLFISSIISNDISPTAYPTLVKFANYVVNNYEAYPEAHLVAMLAYSVTNNEGSLSNQVTYINKNYPTWSIPLYWSLDILARHKHTDTLINILEPIVETSTPDRTLQSVYVASLLNSGQKDRAKSYLLSQLNGSSRNNALLDLGILYAKNKDYANALNSFNQVEESEPQLLSVLALVKGSIYDYQGNSVSAINAYKQVKTAPLTSISQIMLLNAYMSANDYKQTDAILNQYVLENKLNEESAILFKSSYYLGEGKYNIAYDLVKSKIALYETDTNYLYQYAALSGMMNYTKQAISLYKKYIKQNPNKSYGYNDLAYIYADQTTDYNTAKKYALEAYKMTPGDPNVLDTLGWVYYKLGDYNKALPYIKTSYEVNYDAESARHLSAVYMAMNRPDLAKHITIMDKATLQKQLKQQLIQRAVTLVSYIQFGIEVK
jgi:tetratricopeptide (TPR) repeat protein